MSSYETQTMPNPEDMKPKKPTRAQIIARITACGAEGDTRTATRLYLENRISREVYNRAFTRGVVIGRKIAAGMTPFDAMRTTP